METLNLANIHSWPRHVKWLVVMCCGVLGLLFGYQFVLKKTWSELAMIEENIVRMEQDIGGKAPRTEVPIYSSVDDSQDWFGILAERLVESGLVLTESGTVGRDVMVSVVGEYTQLVDFFANLPGCIELKELVVGEGKAEMTLVPYAGVSCDGETAKVKVQRDPFVLEGRERKNEGFSIIDLSLNGSLLRDGERCGLVSDGTEVFCLKEGERVGHEQAMVLEVNREDLKLLYTEVDRYGVSKEKILVLSLPAAE